LISAREIYFPGRQFVSRELHKLNNVIFYLSLKSSNIVFIPEVIFFCYSLVQVLLAVVSALPVTLMPPCCQVGKLASAVPGAVVQSDGHTLFSTMNSIQ
jgi:hypothetical protein